MSENTQAKIDPSEISVIQVTALNVAQPPLALDFETSQSDFAWALNDVTRELGAAIGVASLGAVFSTGYSLTVINRLEGLSPAANGALQRGVANALAFSESSNPQAQFVHHLAQEAFVQGWRQVM